MINQLQMKRILFILSTIAILWGCEKVDRDEPLKEDTPIEEETPDNEVPDSLLTDFVLPEILYASVSDDDGQDEVQDEKKPDTRTFVGDDGSKILWHNGDAVSFFTGNTHNVRYAYTGEDGVKKAELVKDSEISGSTGERLLYSQAVYPYDETITVECEGDKDKINLTYPPTQTYAAGSFGKDANIMVAAGKNNSDEELFFRNACGYLVIKLYGKVTDGKPTKIKSITLSSVSGTDKIAGSAAVLASHDAAPIITMSDDASTAVTLDCSNGGTGVELGTDAENATEFWFCLPPVSFTGGIKISVTEVSDRTYVKQTTKTVNIKRNTIQPMAALEFVSNAPAATRLWYTRSDDEKTPLTFYDGKTNPFNADIKTDGHYYDKTVGKFVIEFNSPLTTIKAEAFRDTKIATINLPEGITTIEEGAFENSKLREITIPGSMINIGVNAFYKCYDLESVTFLPSPTKTPLNLCNIDFWGESGPFYYSKLTSIDLNRELVYVNEDGESFNPDEPDEGIFYLDNHDKVNSVRVTLGPQVNNIWKYMFAYLPIQTLTIPGSVTAIHNDVFLGCTELATLTFEPSPSGTALTMGYDTDGEDENLFQDNNKLTTLNLNREINYTMTGVDTASEGLFGGMPTLTSVTIGNQVSTLSKFMFAESGITELVIPGTVNTIENDVFTGCTKLAKLTYNPSLTGTILTHGYNDDNDDDGPFYDSPLTTINLDREINYTYASSAANANEGLFGNKESLISVTLGNQVRTLSPYMFSNSGIQSITIHAGITSIGEYAFDDCSSLTDLTFETSETALEIKGQGNSDGPFYDSPLTTIDYNRNFVYKKVNGEEFIPSDDSDGIFAISEDARNKVTTTPSTVNIGGLIKTIPDHMFCNLPITELTIPATVTSIGNSVFNNCNNLATLTFEESITPLEIMGQGDSDGPFYDSPLTTIKYNRNFVYKKVNGEEFIPSDDSDGIFAISNVAKNKITGKSVVTIGELIKTIPDYMCNNLAITELTIPKTVANVGLHAFHNCDRLSTITIQDDTKSLNLVTQSYKMLGPFCHSPLNNIHLGRELLYNGGAYNPGSSGGGIFYSNKQEKVAEVTLKISNNVQTISPYMFAHLKLKSITIPASITSIGLNAFVECQSLNSIVFEDSTTPLTVSCHHTWSILGPFHQSPLKSITLGRKINYVDSYGKPFTPSETDDGFFASEDEVESLSITLTNNVQTISEYMFAGRPITQIKIPASVTEIKDHAFQSCTKLESLTIPGTVNTIGNDVFNECTSLASVTFEPSPTKKALKIGYDTDGEDENLFQDSNSLTTLNLDRELDYTLTGIDTESEGLFGGMKKLTSVTLGDQVKTLFPYMFAGTGITELVIPGTVNEIKDFAFYNCEALEDLRFESSSNALTLGFQDWTDELGPFYQSPLKYIKLERDIEYNDNYAASCDGWDEGAFSNKHYDSDDYDWTAKVIIGNQVTTLPKYMFATMRMQQLHIPESVENIGKGLVEKCEVLNAIVLYDKLERPTNVEDGAFGEVDDNYDIPGDKQYYIFVPYQREDGVIGIYYFNQEDTYWKYLHRIMVDDIIDEEQHIQNHHESRYYDKEKGEGEAGIIPGYEWYYQRYYLKQEDEVTPPTK